MDNNLYRQASDSQHKTVDFNSIRVLVSIRFRWLGCHRMPAHTPWKNIRGQPVEIFSLGGWSRPAFFAASG
jgi:hypothetical protein